MSNSSDGVEPSSRPKAVCDDPLERGAGGGQLDALQAGERWRSSVAPTGIRCTPMSADRGTARRRTGSDQSSSPAC